MFEIGDLVRVTAGPFAGMAGIVITPEVAAHIRTGNTGECVSPEPAIDGTYWLSVTVFGHPVPLRLRPEHFERT
jgi:transcription antitermination factor NusG